MEKRIFKTFKELKRTGWKVKDYDMMVYPPKHFFIDDDYALFEGEEVFVKNDNGNLFIAYEGKDYPVIEEAFI